MSRWNFQRRLTLHLLCHLGFGPAIHSSSTVFSTWIDRLGKNVSGCILEVGKKLPLDQPFLTSRVLAFCKTRPQPTDVRWPRHHAKIKQLVIARM
jgi:hypothetical protein